MTDGSNYVAIAHRIALACTVALTAQLGACSGESESPSNTDVGAQDVAEADAEGSPSDVTQAGDTHEDADASAGPLHGGFTHKFLFSTGENPFAQLAYECFECSFETWLATDPPEGWTRGPAQVVVPDDSTLRSTPSVEGYPDAVDFTDDVPGDEYELIARVVDGTIIRLPPNVVAETQVMRDSVLRYSSGRRIHELTDPDGRVFVLFAWEVDPTDPIIPDFDDPAVLGNVDPPEGWTYSSEVLEDELALDTSDIATVLAFRGASSSAWQLR